MVLGPSNIAGKIETSFLIVVSACVVLLVAVTVTMLVFLYKYNSKRHPVPNDIKENIPLEIVWTVIPTILVIFMFYFGWVDFDYIRNPPKGAMNVDVIARQWSWTFRYENGKQSDTLKVPVGKPVKLVLTSEDVIHCLFIPAYRVKEDCVPGLKTHLWFTANEAGTYDIFCTEYCGLEHSHMLSKLITMPAADFNAWYQSKAEVKGKEKGPDLLGTKGCLGCHTTDGTPKIGPTFKGLFGSKVAVLTDGNERVILADEGYLKRAILEPGADIVKGYQNIMPKLPMSEEDLEEIVDYLETLK
jgi:cytochrome c oxidase subunit 2